MKLFPKLSPAVSVARTRNENGMSMKPASGRQCSFVSVPALTSLHFPTGHQTRSGGLETAVSASTRSGRLPQARRSLAEATDCRFWINLFPIIPFPSSSPQTPPRPPPPLVPPPEFPPDTPLTKKAPQIPQLRKHAKYANYSQSEQHSATLRPLGVISPKDQGVSPTRNGGIPLYTHLKPNHTPRFPNPRV